MLPMESDVTTPCTAQAEALPQHRRQLSTLGLAAIIFYGVSGGPYGCEDTVAAAGPLLALAGFLLMPMVWSLPEALISAELATTFPCNSGFVVWVTAAFGPFWGYQEGVLSWLVSVADSAIYPVLFRSYLVASWPAVGEGFLGHAFIIGQVLIMTLLNYAGLAIVGNVAFVLAVFIMLPFVYMFFVGLPKIEGSKLLVMPAYAEIDWSGYLNNLFWNLNYWDTASTLAGEVEDVRTSFPRAMSVALGAVMSTYLLALVVGLGVEGQNLNWRNWKEGTLALVGQAVGGTSLKAWIVAGAAVSNIGQFLSEQAESAYQLQGMADDGWMPACLARRSRFGTPTVGLVIECVLVLLLSSVSTLSDIVQLLNGVYCIAQMIEFCAFLHLRRKYPNIIRPYKVPLESTAACLAMLALPMVFCVIIFSLPFVNGDWRQVFSLLGAVVFSLASRSYLELCRRRRWLTFLRSPPTGLEEILETLESRGNSMLG